MDSPENSVPLTAQELQSHLWEAADILRGSAVDRTDWKGYILPLLFFKRICDVWDEETAEAVRTYGDADSSQFLEVHRFQVPEGCHWRDVRETAANVGTTLARAMQQIELVNPDTLYRVFGAADWANREKFTAELLKDLLEGFSSISLGNTAVETDILGDAYEYLVGKFADVTRRKKAGEFYTPRGVVRMMTEILDPKEGESIYDPACGTGGMLLAAIDHVKRNGGDPRTFFGKIYGQEKKSHDLLGCPDESGPPRHRRLPDCSGRHPARSRLHRRCWRPRHLRLRNRQSTVLAKGMGPRGLGERPLGPGAAWPAPG